jgi:large subunit ribosomal protein L11
MAKKVEGVIKLHILAGKASPAPPVGPALGQKGVNIMEFCKAFNAKTASMPSDARIPVKIDVYKGKSFSFSVTKPTASYYLRKAASLSKGATNPGRDKAVSITLEQVTEIAKEKMEDMNAFTLESAVAILRGTARSMGIEVIG